MSRQELVVRRPIAVLAITRALVNNLPLALAGEPTGALDSHTTGDIRRRCGRPNAEEGLAIILMTHDARRKRRRRSLLCTRKEK